MAPLGEAYQDRVAEGLESRWVDVYDETANKQSGAYSGGTYDSQPFILMNYQDDVESMYTLAHELGHSLHLGVHQRPPALRLLGLRDIRRRGGLDGQRDATDPPPAGDGRGRATATARPQRKYLERFRSTLYRQTMFAEFEHRTHEMDEAGEP